MRNRLDFVVVVANAFGRRDPALRAARALLLNNAGAVQVARGDTQVLFDAFFEESFDGEYLLVPDEMVA